MRSAACPGFYSGRMSPSAVDYRLVLLIRSCNIIRLAHERSPSFYSSDLMVRGGLLRLSESLSPALTQCGRSSLSLLTVQRRGHVSAGR